MTRRIKSSEKRRSPHVYSSKQIKFIKDRYCKMSVTDLLEEFNKTFPDQLTKWQLYRLNYKLKIKDKNIVSCRNKPLWSDEMIEFCRKHADEYSYREMAEELTKKFKKPIREEQITSLYSRKGIRNHKPTAFVKGMTPHNKGKKWDEYLTKEQQAKQRATCFKKGNRPQKWKPVGTIVTRKDSSKGFYNWIKVKDNNGTNNFMMYSRYVYEQENGVKLGSEDIILHLDGNTLNDNIDNLYKVSQKEHATLNKMYSGINDPELKMASILAVRARKKVKELTK